MPNYVASVGMEVHAELATASKMFCRCPVAFGEVKRKLHLAHRSTEHLGNERLSFTRL